MDDAGTVRDCAAVGLQVTVKSVRDGMLESHAPFVLRVCLQWALAILRMNQRLRAGPLFATRAIRFRSRDFCEAPARPITGWAKALKTRAIYQISLIATRRNPPNIAPVESSATSCSDAILPGTKVWWPSSSKA